MAFSFIERKGIERQNLLSQFMQDLDSIDGWVVWDDRITVGNYFVMQMNTSEGVGNELYIQFLFTTATDDLLRMRMGENFDATAHAWVGEVIQSHYIHLGGGTTTTATSLIDYRLSGDTDWAVLTGYRQDGGLLRNPMYVGLLNKADSFDTQPRCATAFAEYHWEGWGTFWDESGRLPLLRGYGGQFNAYARMAKTTLHHRSEYRNEFLDWGPWGPDKLVFSATIPIWEDNWGIRGYIHGCRMASGAANTSLARWETVVIGGDEYYWWQSNNTDYYADRRGPWQLNNYWSTGSNRHGLFILKAKNNI